MTEAATTMEAAVVTPARRHPRPPAGATRLLVAWAMVSGAALAVFVWSLIDVGHMDGWDLKGAMMVVVMASWGFLFWRAKLFTRMDRMVRAKHGRVCLNCHASLTSEGERGECPRCDEEFVLAQVRDAWNRSMP